MALPAISYQQNLHCLGTENPWVIGSTQISVEPQQASWLQNPREARCSLLIRPHCCNKIVKRTQCSRSVHSPLRGQIFVASAVHSRLLHRCNALPAMLSCFNLSDKVVDVEGIMEDNEEDEKTPWEGAVMFRRSAVQSEFEYNTTLERLGLSRYSTEKSSSLAESMGLKTLKLDEEVGTPVQISIEVTKEGRDFQLDGIIKTSLGLICNRCLSPVAERIFATFSLLLTESPVNEPDRQTLGVVLGADAANIWKAEAKDEAEDQLDIDLDDKLHFPHDVKEVDLSKYLRDTIHLEIPAKSLCDTMCQGLCMTCGVDLNNSPCQCGTRQKSKQALNMDEIMGADTKKDVWGPLQQLRKQLREQEESNEQ